MCPRLLYGDAFLFPSHPNAERGRIFERQVFKIPRAVEYKHPLAPPARLWFRYVACIFKLELQMLPAARGHNNKGHPRTCVRAMTNLGNKKNTTCGRRSSVPPPSKSCSVSFYVKKGDGKKKLLKISHLKGQGEKSTKSTD